MKFDKSMSAVPCMNADEELGSVSHWLKELKTGDSQAVEAIWQRYYRRVVEFAIRKMKVNPDRSVDGEDIAQLAMHGFCRSATSGCYPDLDDREQLWDILVVFTLNRIRKHLRACNTLKRSGLRSLIFEFKTNDALKDLQSPEAPTIMADLVNSWLARLDQEDPTGQLKQIAIWTMDDISGSEIARILKKRKSLILQQIRLIRLLWEECET
jgi:DNA-directed RNA polymerase specialized sigma24 family protein